MLGGTVIRTVGEWAEVVATWWVAIQLLLCLDRSKCEKLA